MVKIEVTVTITVESSDIWQYQLFDAMQNIGASIMTKPEFNAGKGDAAYYTYEYTMKGVE